jgi:hypothetical protein
MGLGLGKGGSPSHAPASMLGMSVTSGVLSNPKDDRKRIHITIIIDHGTPSRALDLAQDLQISLLKVDWTHVQKKYNKEKTKTKIDLKRII